MSKVSPLLLFSKASGRKKAESRRFPSAESFTELLLSDNEVDASAQLIDAYLQSHALATLFDTTVTNAMHRIGDLWVQGNISIADEHLATRVMLSALQKLRAIVVPGEGNGLMAISCGIEGDLHEMPVHLAEILFEMKVGTPRILDQTLRCLRFAIWWLRRNPALFVSPPGRLLIWIGRRQSMHNFVKCWRRSIAQRC